MAAWFAFIAGLGFGCGLIVSGLANPRKVLGFLDLAGAWDPSLAFMLAKRRTRSWLGLPMQLPTARAITVRLVGGSALFGLGWGLAGICPGPAVVSVGFGSLKGIGFVVAMLAGMAVFEWIERRRAAPRAGAGVISEPSPTDSAH